MTPERFEEIERLCQASLDTPAEQRSAFLDAACGGDAELRAEVEALLRGASSTGSLLAVPPVMPPLVLLAVGQRLGPYEIAAEIGAGGMGLVYRARDTRLGRPVAVKTIRGAAVSDGGARERFGREAQAIAALNHPHICALYDVGREGELDFLVMEYLEGETLATRLARGRLALDEVLEFGAQIADALARAHSCGIVHRDLKPGNVMLTRDGAKLLDFGLAKLKAPAPAVAPAGRAFSSLPTSAPLTGAGAVFGTAPYMSPEQLEGKDADARSDIFSFGVVLYEMLTGQRAFQADSHAGVIVAIMTGQPAPVSACRPETPVALERLVERCLEKEVSRREQSASAIAGALREIARMPEEHLKDALVPTISTLAILPLENLTGSRARQYLVDGLHDELITVLSGIASLEVTARSSARRYRRSRKPLRQVARELAVEAIVEGAVRASGNALKVRLSLVDGKSERVLWTGRFERPLDDVPRLESDIAVAVARELRTVVTPAERERLTGARRLDAEAFKLFRRGNRLAALLHPGAMHQALRCYREAIAREPRYAAAHVALARTLLELGGYWGSADKTERRAEARVAIERAIEIDPTVAEAYMVLGLVRAMQWDWAAAEEAFHTGVALGPTESLTRVCYANYLSAMSRFDESLAFTRRTVRLDPFEPLAWNELCGPYWCTGRQSVEADQAFERSLQIDRHFHQTLMAGITMYAASNPARALEFLERLEKNRGAPPGPIAVCCALLGERERARHWLDVATHGPVEVSPAILSWFWGLLGEPAKSLDSLERAYAEHDPLMMLLRVNPLWAPVRGEPRFEAILAKMDFPPVPPAD